jgi:hypothetical protein
MVVRIDADRGLAIDDDATMMQDRLGLGVVGADSVELGQQRSTEARMVAWMGVARADRTLC